MTSDASNELERARKSAAAMYAEDAASQMLGIEIDVLAVGEAVARMTVRDDMVNGFDVCHGGIVFTLADTAFAFACNAYNNVTLSVSAKIDWLIPAMRGDALVARAREVDRQGRHGDYAIDVHNQHDELVARFEGHCIATNKAVFDESK